MKLFNDSIFSTTAAKLQKTYEDGVLALQDNDHYLADQLLKEAAEMGHPSAMFNLSVLHASGVITPYDIDYATQCRRNAAEAGHPKAASEIQWIDAADRGGFGTTNLALMASGSSPQASLSSLMMICACRYFQSITEMHDETRSVLILELGGMQSCADPAVASFADRAVGLPQMLGERDYWVESMEAGSALEQITSGIDSFYSSMRKAGWPERMSNFARCSVIGYMAKRSKYANREIPLLGLDKFYV